MVTAQKLFAASLKNPWKQEKKLRFEALMAVNIKTVVFWDVPPCSLIEGSGLMSIQLIGTVHSPKTLITFYQATWHHNKGEAKLYVSGKCNKSNTIYVNSTV
jgi:hypothetical protein